MAGAPRSTGSTVAGDTKRVRRPRRSRRFTSSGPCDQTKLIAFAEHIAAIAGKQAVIGETDDEFWFVEQAARQGRSTEGQAQAQDQGQGEALMTRTLIKDGTVVTASDTFAADVWIENGKIAALVAAGHAARQRRPDDRRDGQVRHPGRHRRAHAPRHAVRRHELVGRLRHRHASPRRTAARRRSSTSRSSRRAARCARASTRGTRKAEGKARDRLRAST